MTIFGVQLYLKGIFDNCGLSYVWVNQDTALPNLNEINLLVKNSLQDQFIQSWLTDMQNSSRGKFYCSFKSEFIFNIYVCIKFVMCRVL